MTIGIRGRLFGVSLLVIAVVGLAAGALLESQLRGLLERRLERTLVAQTLLARELLTRVDIGDSEASDQLADSLGIATDARVTLIGLDGVVQGDSSLSLDEVRAVDDHGQRPEVLQARQKGTGRSRRYSHTLGTDMLYVAAVYPAGGPARGLVRVALPMSEVDQATTRLRLMMLAAAAVGLLLAVLLSGIASELLTRALRDMVRRTRALVEGERQRPGDLDSELAHLAGSFHRVADELQEAVSELAGERDRLETILEHMSEAVLALDADDRITIANTAAFELLAFDDDDVGRPLLEAMRIPELAELARRCLDQDKASVEFEPPGRGRRVLARAAPLRALGGAVIVMHDVTETRRVERMRRDFVANVSHELRTPVSVIRAGAETLLDGGLDDTARAPSFVAAIHRNAERLGRLIADLLDLSRIEAGGYELKLGPVRLKPAVDGTCEALAAKADERSITVAVDMSEDLTVRADATALGQIVQNFLDNAIKYAPEGGHVSVRASVVEPASVRVEVEDDGPGIEPKHRERVFERFYRIDPGRSRELGGTGLGLSIVRNLAESMGGRVGMKPAEGNGSVFWLELPRD